MKNLLLGSERKGPGRWCELKQFPELFYLSGHFWVSCEYYIHYHAEKRNLIPTRNWVAFFPPYCSDFWFIICPHRTSFIITPVWCLICLCSSLSGLSYFLLWHQIFLVPSIPLCWDLAKLQSQGVLLKCGCAHSYINMKILCMIKTCFKRSRNVCAQRILAVWTDTFSWDNTHTQTSFIPKTPEGISKWSYTSIFHVHFCLWRWKWGILIICCFLVSFMQRMKCVWFYVQWLWMQDMSQHWAGLCPYLLMK